MRSSPHGRKAPTPPATSRSSPDAPSPLAHRPGARAASAARDVHGDIEDAYLHLGGPACLLGGPLTDETRTPNGLGRYNAFEGGSIYWTPATGAHEVHGAIRDAWAAQGYENGRLGFPTSDESPAFDARSQVPGSRSDFQGGCILWDAQHGATVLSPPSACPPQGD